MTDALSTFLSLTVDWHCKVLCTNQCQGWSDVQPTLIAVSDVPEMINVVTNWCGANAVGALAHPVQCLTPSPKNVDA